MAESRFDRRTFAARLTTRALGRTLILRAELPSTNDAAWEALARGAPDGLVVVADAQPAGRGRGGRAWHTVPGRGLALSALLRDRTFVPSPAPVPLAAGLALARGLERLGVAVDLKWPNDLLLGGRKLAGVLCESRAAGGPPGAAAIVIGVGVNVAQRAEDFPSELRRGGAAGGRPATSLALEGHAAGREAVAAEFLNALEPLLAELADRGPGPLLDAWRGRAAFWGEPVRALTPAGEVSGVARDLDPEGGLIVALEGGGVATVRAGDVEPTRRDAP